jgi:hypothetical protein
MRKLVGEEHPHTATSYNNLATNQYAQGTYAEAERNHRKALDVARQQLGEEHSFTTTCYNNLAANQNAQRKFADAEGNLLKALDLRRLPAGLAALRRPECLRQLVERQRHGPSAVDEPLLPKPARSA